jgi:hypothetical protein
MTRKYRATIRYPESHPHALNNRDFYFHTKADRNYFLDWAMALGCEEVSYGIIHIQPIEEALQQVKESLNLTAEEE